MRYECDDEAFSGDFIEYSDSWSRAQVRATWAAWSALPDAKVRDEEAQDAAIEVLLAQLRPKTIALHLTCVDAAPISDPMDLTAARTEEMDTRLYEWWVNAWIVHLRDLATLGNALGRRLYSISEPATNGAEKEIAVAP